MINKKIISSYKFVFVPIVCAMAWIIYFVMGSYNWGQSEDFLIVDVFRKLFITRENGYLEVLQLFNNGHPVGFQLLFSAIIVKLFGLNFVSLVLVNFSVALISALILILLFVDRKYTKFKWLSSSLILIAFLHPSQINHFLWPFEFGWYLVIFFTVASIAVVEKKGIYSIAWTIPLAIFSTFSSGQGALIWLVLALQYLIRISGMRRWYVFSIYTLVFLTVVFIQLGVGQIDAVASYFSVDFIQYFFQLYGSVTGVKQPNILLMIGVIIFAISLLSFLSILNKNNIASCHLVGLLLIFTSVLFVMAFALARFKYGLPWALDRIHAAPLVCLIFSGMVLLLQPVDLQNNQMQRTQFYFYFVAFTITLSALASTSYSSQRSHEQTIARAFSMKIFCDGNKDQKFISNAADTDLANYWLLERNREVLQPLCNDEMPADAKALLSMPIEFEKISELSNENLDALNDLWKVYQTHYDLQRAFPIRSADLYINLIRFASADAKGGSKYDNESLGSHSKTYIDIEQAISK